MKSMKIDDKYRILFDGERLPQEVDQTKLDSALASIKDCATTLQKLLASIDNDDENIRKIVYQILDTSCVQYDEGKIWKLNFIIDTIDDIQKQLTHDDEILPYEDVETIFDNGFKEDIVQKGFYQKVIEDSEKQEVVEELFIKEKPIYRKRTIIWETFPNGKHSKEIKYEILPISDKLQKLIDQSNLTPLK